MTQQSRSGSGRRDFIRLAGLGAVAGSVGLAGTAEPTKAEEAAAPGARPGYRETDHVRKAYEVARF